jgi:hypothetical protein
VVFPFWQYKRRFGVSSGGAVGDQDAISWHLEDLK